MLDLFGVNLQHILATQTLWCPLLHGQSSIAVVLLSDESLYYGVIILYKVDDLVVSQRLLELNDPGLEDEICKI